MKSWQRAVPPLPFSPLSLARAPSPAATKLIMPREKRRQTEGEREGRVQRSSYRKDNERSIAAGVSVCVNFAARTALDLSSYPLVPFPALSHTPAFRVPGVVLLLYVNRPPLLHFQPTNPSHPFLPFTLEKFRWNRRWSRVSIPFEIDASLYPLRCALCRVPPARNSGCRSVEAAATFPRASVPVKRQLKLGPKGAQGSEGCSRGEEAERRRGAECR